jgi:hypothetical protein
VRRLAVAILLLAAAGARASGPPVLLERTTVAAHALVTLDASGRVLASTRRSAYVVAPCPAGRRAISWRFGTSGLSDVLSIASLHRVGPGPPTAPERAVFAARCIDSAGRTALAIVGRNAGTVGELRRRTRRGGRTVLRGVYGEFGIPGGRLVARVKGEDAIAFYSARSGRLLCRLRIPGSAEFAEGSPDGEQVAFRIGGGLGGRVAVVDPWSRRPRLRMLPGRGDSLLWLSPWRLAVWTENGVDNYVRARILDVRGDVLGALRHLPAVPSAVAVAGGFVYFDAVGLYRASGLGGRFRRIPQAHAVDELVPVERL